MPAQQLRDRLGAVFDESVWLRVLAAQAAWLHHGYGDGLADIHTLVVHETSGLSARADATSIFEHHFQTTAPTAANPQSARQGRHHRAVRRHRRRHRHGGDGTAPDVPPCPSAERLLDR